MPLVKLYIAANPEVVKASYELIEEAKLAVGITGDKRVTPEQQQALQAKIDELVEARNMWPIALEWEQ